MTEAEIEDALVRQILKDDLFQAIVADRKRLKKVNAELVDLLEAARAHCFERPADLDGEGCYWARRIDAVLLEIRSQS